MLDIKAWAENAVEWAAKDRCGFLTTIVLVLTPLFLASGLLSWKLAKMIEAREKEQKKQKHQENIAKLKPLKKIEEPEHHLLGTIIFVLLKAVIFLKELGKVTSSKDCSEDAK
ncbi:small integral membrane protein 15-like [Nannospalax galili]|uniref:small integral membrane protein 15-like n=1 Tax=Nannospalax galili TaxID=1026970 RepID=UPI0004ED1E5F|nr:small integral membrane protein 15-like [Nannospalax galili]